MHVCFVYISGCECLTAIMCGGLRATLYYADPGIELRLLRLAASAFPVELSPLP